MRTIYSLLVFMLLYSALAAQTPGKPGIPTGINGLCQKSGSTDYQTIGTENATSYQWQLFPENAGSIAGSAKSSRISWNPEFYGEAKVCVKGINNNVSGETSDTLYITIHALPSGPGQISGNSRICKGMQEDVYLIEPTENTDSYTWHISPSYAGTAIANNTKLIVNWNPEFRGLAQIFVFGNNICGEGDQSPIKNIDIVTVPTKPSPALGPNTICQGKDTTVFLTTSSLYATSYHWIVVPSNAAEVTTADTAAIFTWNPDFTDTAHIQLQSVNECGTSEVTDWRTIKVRTIPASPLVSPDIQTLCQNESSSTYSASLVKDAMIYTWTILPAEAGTIAGEFSLGTVVWNAAFTGNAYISVYASNNCGQGPNSNIAAITRFSLPKQPTPPFGADHICAGAENVIYSTYKSDFSSSYTWSISPFNAGTITNTDTTAIFNIGREYVGLVRIKVQGVNYCGNSPYSSEFEIRSHENPTAIFTNSDNGFTYNFVNTSIPGLPHEKLTWRFGDGQTSAEQNPVHTYTTNGTYKVLLRIDADYCESDSTQKDIVITYYSVEKNQIEGLTWSVSPGKLHISMPSAIVTPTEWQLTTLTGATILSQKLEYLDSETELNLPHLPDGVYLARLRSGNLSNSFKFVIEN